MTLLRLLLVVPAVLAFAPCSRRSPATIPLCFLVLVIGMWGLGGRPASTIVAIVGTPSIPTIALLVDAAVRRFTVRRLLSVGERRTLLWFLAAASLVVYPPFLAIVDTFDFYRLGFLAGAPGLVALMGIAAVFRRHFGLAGVALGALIALDAHLLTSVNVFDSLLDPYAGIYSLGWAFVQIAGAVRRKFTGTHAPVSPPDSLEPMVS